LPAGSFQATSGQPETLVIQSSGGAESTNANGVKSYAEYGNVFVADATATSACAVQPEFSVHFESAPLLPVREGYSTAILNRNQSGGIKEPDW
jgi:hypothetical protein